MFNLSFTFYRLHNYLVLHSRNNKNYMLENGYPMLCQFRKQVQSSSLEDALLDLYLKPGNQQMKQFILYLVSIGFIEARIPRDYSDELQCKLNVYDELYEKLNATYRNAATPIDLFIEVEASCNFHCQQCERGQDNPCQVPHKLSLKQYDLLFREFEEMGGRHVVFTGGEPLLRSDFRDILSLTNFYGFSVSILSNGSLFSGNDVTFMKTIRLDSIQISLLGNEEDYLLMTGNDYFDNVINTLNMFKKNGIPYTVLCPLTNSNISAYAHLNGMANEHPISFFLMDGSFPINRNGCLCKYMPESDPPELDSAIKPSEVNYRYKREIQKACSTGTEAIFVNVSGDVFRGVKSETPIGNLHQQRFAELIMKIPDKDNARSAMS